MSTATITAREDQASAKPDNVRRCIVTGDVRPKDELIRFAVSPDFIITPDLARNLPGRGLWVTATREAIETARRKNAFAKAAKAVIKCDPDLADKVAALLKTRCLAMLGLARGAGIAVLGQTQVEAALKAGKLALLFVAEDAAAAGLEKIDRAAPAQGIRIFTRGELGMALGYEQIVYAGLEGHGLAEKLKIEIARLEKIAGKDHLSKETDSGTK